jgi:hypothetical protein
VAVIKNVFGEVFSPKVEISFGVVGGLLYGF